MSAPRLTPVARISPLETDLGTYFDTLWRAIDEADVCELRVAPTPSGKVRLECVGEFVDLASIGPTLVRQAARGAELVEFICPRCNDLHESRRLG